MTPILAGLRIQDMKGSSVTAAVVVCVVYGGGGVGAARGSGRERGRASQDGHVVFENLHEREPEARAAAVVRSGVVLPRPRFRRRTRVAIPRIGKKDEALWRERIRGEREALERAKTFAEALQSRINALNTDFVNRDDPVQRSGIAADREALAELERLKKEIEQHTKAIATIQEEARRAGVPAGWVR